MSGRSISEAARLAHLGAVERGAPAYIDPDTGLLVLTAHELLRRGSCCGWGCRHCPYPRTPGNQPPTRTA